MKKQYQTNHWNTVDLEIAYDPQDPDHQRFVEMFDRVAEEIGLRIRPTLTLAQIRQRVNGGHTV